jgi:hypothetical protein
MTSFAKHRLRVQHLVEEPSGLREEGLDLRVSFAEKVEEDEVFDCGELGWGWVAEQATFRVRVYVA